MPAEHKDHAVTQRSSIAWGFRVVRLGERGNFPLSGPALAALPSVAPRAVETGRLAVSAVSVMDCNQAFGSLSAHRQTSPQCLSAPVRFSTEHTACGHRGSAAAALSRRTFFQRLWHWPNELSGEWKSTLFMASHAQLLRSFAGQLVNELCR